MLDINALFIKKNRHDKNKFCAMSDADTDAEISKWL